MPTICDRCGKPSYVTYVKSNPGRICDACEDRERRHNGTPNEWKSIQAHNHQYRYEPHKLKSRGNVLYLQSYRKITDGYERFFRHLESRNRAIRKS